MRARVIAAGGEGERQAAEHLNLGHDTEFAGLRAEGLNRARRHFRRQADIAGAPARQHGNRAFVVDVHERADVVRPSAQPLQSGGIVCLHEAVFGADVSHQIAVELRHHLGQRRKDDGFAGVLEPCRDRIEKRLKQRRALGADHLAEIDG